MYILLYTSIYVSFIMLTSEMYYVTLLLCTYLYLIIR